MYWAFAFITIMLITGTLTTCYFAYLGWMLRRSTGAIAFILLMLSISIWSISYALEQFTPLLDEKILWHKMAYLGIPFVPLAWFIFNAQVLGIRFASQPHWIGLLAIVPVATALLTWTYEHHSLMWGEFDVNSDTSITYLTVERMPEYFYYAAYSYLLLGAGIWLFVKVLHRSPSIGAPSIAVMTLAVSAAVVFNMMHIAINFDIFGPYDLSPISLASIGVIAGWFVFRFGPLDVLSVARVALLENINDGFIVLGLSNTVVSMNSAAQRLLGVTEREANGLELQALLPEGSAHLDATSGRTIYNEMIGLGIHSSEQPDTTQVHHELVLPNPDDIEEDLFVDLSISNLFDRRNRPRGSLIILRDVTQKKQAQQAVIQAQRVESAGVLAGGVAHDFNNLLAAITMRHELAIDELGEAAEPHRLLFEEDSLREQNQDYVDSVQAALRHLNISRKAVGRASDLTRQLLAYTGKGDFKIEPVELNDLINENRELLATAVPMSVDLMIAFSPESLYIFADKGQLQQVIMNLILNAAEAIVDANGKIDVQTSLVDVGNDEAKKFLWKSEPISGTYACLSVTDSGTGMSSELQAKIFDPFFTTKKDGRGLGLSALLGAIHLYDGGIQVSSKKEKGTTFRVLLPTVSVPSHGVTEESPRHRYMNNVHEVRTILVVDDEEPILDVLDEVLTDMGLDVITASNGYQAIEIFKMRQAEIDLVLLDAKMPYIDGVETLTLMRELNPNTRALLSSGYSEQHLSATIQWDKQTDFIQKPYEIDKLLEKIESLLVESAAINPKLK